MPKAKNKLDQELRACDNWPGRRLEPSAASFIFERNHIFGMFLDNPKSKCATLPWFRRTKT